MVKKRGGMGVAIDNCCALELVDEEFRVITSRPSPGVYRVYRARGGVAVEQIPQKRDFTVTSTLPQNCGPSASPSAAVVHRPLLSGKRMVNRSNFWLGLNQSHLRCRFGVSRVICQQAAI